MISPDTDKGVHTQVPPRPHTIAVYGGSFDPIHTGHTMIASQVAVLPDVDEVWLMISPENPFKQGRRMASETDRLEMARLAVAGMPHVRVSDFEFSLPRPSYTYDTLKALRESRPDCRFRIIIGSDNWRDFAGWRNGRKIVEEFGVIVYPRPDVPLTPDFNPFSDPLPDGSVTLLPPDAPRSPASSTAIRAALAEGRVPHTMLLPSVATYISTRHLYTSATAITFPRNKQG